jgi:asparagine synthase (glutamine-hydrolysing)
MCGICGIIDLYSGVPISRDVLIRMTRAMKHRGPDEEGTYSDGPVGLGSRRLSIIDLVGGKQPITNEQESMWIVFNGEIYNYRELRVYLEKRGHAFRTQTDTEVILHLYEEFGPECVQHLNGIFAFAIWDIALRRVTIARDRVGVKPLYYAQVGDQLVFGSEMKVLLAHPSVKRDIDLIALNEYLSYEYVPSPRTIFRGIRRLEPGHVLSYSTDGLKLDRYWDASFALSESRSPVHWRDYADSLCQTLRDAVRQELVSDVPVGVLLSGGIDSSTIAALMAEQYPGTIESFSIGFREASFDESRYARLVADHLGIRHNELVLTSDMVAEMVPSITDFLDEPFGDSSLIPTYFLSLFARGSVKVVLGGDGGDELFAGYPSLIAHRLIEYYERVIPWGVRASAIPKVLGWMPVSFSNMSLDFRVRRFISGRGVPLHTRHHRWLGSFVDEEKTGLLQDWIKPVLRETFAQAYVHAQTCDAHEPLNQVLYDDVKMYLEGDILYKVDRASMASSLEVRVPFLNRDVVDFATQLPLDLKLHRLTTKYLLKKSVEHLLPDQIINRPKKGFNMPVADWLGEELHELVQDMFSQDFVRRQGLFNHGFIERLLSEHLAHRRDNRKSLWTLLMFQLWYHAYVG